MKKTKFSELWNNKRVQMVVAVLLAFAAWMVVYFVQPEQTQPVSNILVDLDYNSPAYTSQGLDIIDRTPIYVSIKVKGNGSAVNSLQPSDFIAYPDYNTVKGEGTYELQITVKKSSTFEQYEIIDVDVSTVTLKFDKVTTKKFPIIVSAEGVSPDDGYYMDTAVTSPSEVTVRGPETLVNSIAKVVAPVVVTGEKRKESIISSAMLEMQDKNGSIISDASLALDVEQVEVTIPILKVKEVPLVVAFTSVPTGYDTTQLKPQLSVDTIRVAGTESQVDAINEITIGYVDLANFTLGEEEQFTLTLPDGLINLDSLLSVSVSFDTSALVQQTVTITEIRPVNVPSNMDITVTTAKINNVTLIGTLEELESLASTSVIAQIDASDISVVNGQQKVPVTIIIPSAKTVFATGVYTVLCNIKTS